MHVNNVGMEDKG